MFDNHEERLAILAAARREVEDILLVMGSRMKRRMAVQVERSAALGARVDKLVSSIGQLIARIPPSALTQ